MSTTLQERRTFVTQLAEPFNMTLPAISKHLKVLENAGLIVRSRQAQWRPCKLDPAPMEEVANWLYSYRKMSIAMRHIGTLFGTSVVGRAA
jgi:DNA-binding transcriptional ArsR family regulator